MDIELDLVDVASLPDVFKEEQLEFSYQCQKCDQVVSDHDIEEHVQAHKNEAEKETLLPPQAFCEAIIAKIEEEEVDDDIIYEGHIFGNKNQIFHPHHNLPPPPPLIPSHHQQYQYQPPQHFPPYQQQQQQPFQYQSITPPAEYKTSVQNQQYFLPPQQYHHHPPPPPPPTGPLLLPQQQTHPLPQPPQQQHFPAPAPQQQYQFITNNKCFKPGSKLSAPTWYPPTPPPASSAPPIEYAHEQIYGKQEIVLYPEDNNSSYQEPSPPNLNISQPSAPQQRLHPRSTNNNYSNSDPEAVVSRFERTHTVLIDETGNHGYYNRYACDLCGKRFLCTLDLVNHANSFHKVNPYLQCEVCGRQYKTKHTLMKHHKLKHGDK